MTESKRGIVKKKALVVLGALMAVTFGWAAVASAHVTVSPSSLPQGTGDAILTFRVPNESTTASVSGLRIEFPIAHPIVVLSPQAGSGWQTRVVSEKLPKPITTDDGTFTTTVSEIDWSGGSIPVGQFGLFNVLAQGIPTGTNELVFKAIQLYSDGTTVSWIQIPDKAVPDPLHPAPVIQLTRGGSSSGTSSTSPPAAAVATTTGGGDGNGSGLSILALIVALFAVVVAGLAVWLGRPRVRSD
jgi:uncharacterized protein YcnI